MEPGDCRADEGWRSLSMYESDAVVARTRGDGGGRDEIDEDKATGRRQSGVLAGDSGESI